MRSRYLIVVVILLAVWGKASQGADTSKQAVDGLFAKWNSAGSPGAVVAVAQDGKILFSAGYGAADLRYGLPIGRDTVFAVGSVSKQFTAFAIFTLADQGKLGLDDDVRKYLDFVPDYGEAITVRELLQHTSGLRDYFELASMSGVQLDDLYTQDFLIKLISSQEGLNFKPGTQERYTNTEYFLLAKIIEKVTGQPFRVAMDRLVFAPLGMEHSSFVGDPRVITPSLATSYWPDGQGGYLTAALGADMPGAGGLRTTVADMLKWEQNLDTKAFGGDAVAQMFSRSTLRNGTVVKAAASNGVAIDNYRGLSTIESDGGIAGFRAYVLNFPQQRFSVAIFTNLITFYPEEEAERIADIYLGADLGPKPNGDGGNAQHDAAAKAPTGLKTTDYVGLYRSGAVDSAYQVCVDRPGLKLAQLRNDEVKLSPVGSDLFEGDHWWLHRVRFLRDAGGHVIALQVTGFRAVDDLQFERIPGVAPYCASR